MEFTAPAQWRKLPALQKENTVVAVNYIAFEGKRLPNAEI